MLEISKRLIDISEMTRVKEKIDKIFKIVLHHTPIKGATAIANRNYINDLKKQDDIFCSYHYIIDFDETCITTPLYDFAVIVIKNFVYIK